MTLSSIQGINPLFCSRPDVFWTLFEAQAPSVELIIKTHHLPRAEAVRLFGLWEASKKDDRK